MVVEAFLGVQSKDIFRGGGGRGAIKKTPCKSKQKKNKNDSSLLSHAPGLGPPLGTTLTYALESNLVTVLGRKAEIGRKLNEIISQNFW